MTYGQPYATCSACRQPFAITKGGNIYPHKSRGRRCSGAGRLPLKDHRLGYAEKGAEGEAPVLIQTGMHPLADAAECDACGQAIGILDDRYAVGSDTVLCESCADLRLAVPA